MTGTAVTSAIGMPSHRTSEYLRLYRDNAHREDEEAGYRASGRQLHLSRSSDWRESSSKPISLEEWIRFADGYPGLDEYLYSDFRTRGEAIAAVMQDEGISRSAAIQLLREKKNEQRETDMIMSRPDLIAKHPGMPEAYLKNAAARKVFSLKRGDGTRLRFFWRKSQVTVSGIGPDATSDVALIRPIAQALEARVLTADGTIYE